MAASKHIAPRWFRGSDLSGRRFGRLLVQGRVTRNGFSHWLCVCDCGNETIVQAISLTSGRTKSCGCIPRENTKYPGMRGNRTYTAWHGMKARCNSKWGGGNPNYGGRGIRVCDRWLDFNNFLQDMGECPPGLTLDRIDSNGNYEPGNCRWATRKQQQRNRRVNVIITAFGESKTVAEWLEDPRCTIHRSALIRRLAIGVRPDMAVTLPSTPLNQRRRGIRKSA